MPVISYFLPPGQVAKIIIKKFKYTWRKSKTPQSSEDQDVESTLPPPPIPPRTTDMFIAATVSSTSTAGTESTTVDDVIVTDSVLMDVGTTNTPTNAHCHTITLRAMNENFSSGSAPLIPPHTNEMYLLKDNSSEWGTPVLNTSHVQMTREEIASFWRDLSLLDF